MKSSENKYLDVVYGSSQKHNQYPNLLIEYLNENFICNQNLNKVLDLGCGNGMFLEALKNCYNNAQTHGVDFRIDENISDHHKINACNFELDQLPYEDNSFDLIFSKSVLEHVRGLDHFTGEIKRVLSKNGHFICMVPEWNSQKNHFYDDYTHVSPFTPKGLRNCLQSNGFKVCHIQVFYQLPFLWKMPYLKFLPILLSLLPDSLKWKTTNMETGKERKLIRFSKEKMILCHARKH